MNGRLIRDVNIAIYRVLHFNCYYYFFKILCFAFFCLILIYKNKTTQFLGVQINSNLFPVQFPRPIYYEEASELIITKSISRKNN